MSIPTYGRPIRWSIAATAAATTLFALLLASGWLLFDALGQTNPCDTTTVVSDQTNTGLVNDCKALWAAKDDLRGTPALNWNATTAITSWQSITVSGTTPRVTVIYFAGTSGLTQALDGQLPPELGNLSALTTLWISDNSLTGSIPKELGNLSNLRILALNRNDLTGSIPKELGNLSSLQELYLNGNDLTGSIPSELGNLSSLDDLWLNSNDLTGSIPPQLGNLSNLTILRMQDNMLSGPIPSELGNLSNLTDLWLHRNWLSGEFPSWVSNMSSLQVLDMHGNRLTGILPLEYPFPSSVTAAQIGRDAANPGEDNMFIGCLPSWATSNTAVRGEENLGLPNCSTPPRESIWVLDTVLAPPSPVRGSSDTGMTKTRLTLRATYTIPSDYITSTTTAGKLQFRELRADIPTTSAITVSIARPATTTAATLVGFDGRTGSPQAHRPPHPI